MIELMVVIGIIALLITIAVPAFTTVIKQSKRTSTAATINTLSIGIESYRTDSQIGGAYPPSYGIVNNGTDGVVSPHQNNSNAAKLPRVDGANLIAWALVGADLLGTPGFRNADGLPDPGVNYGGWTTDMGTNPAAGNVPAGLYALDSAGKPLYQRAGQFADLSKMSLPKRDSTNKFIVDKLDTKPQLDSICFLDTFHQPILYYKANAGKRDIADYEPVNPSNPNNVGIYNLNDNAYITGAYSGGSVVYTGLDFGAGPIPGATTFHPLAHLNAADSDPIAATALPALTPADKGSFAYTIWNPNVTAVPRPYHDDSYLLLSAGADGEFGTSDDVANADLFAEK